MIRSDLSTVCRRLGGVLRGSNAQFEGISTDSRTLTAGQLFVALKGERFDGQAYLGQARAKGASGAIVAEPFAVTDLAVVTVPDTLAALGALAAWWRREQAAQVVAITGSNGKTTVKEMIAAILREQAGDSVLATRGNLNNEIGLPLTLARLGPQHQFAVLELGASAPGEIKRLAHMAGPRVAIVNNAGPAHLEGFGTVAGVARCKGEIFSALAADGVALFNGDDVHAGVWREQTKSLNSMEFGLSRERRVWGEPRSEDGSHFVLHHDRGRLEIKLSLPGHHNLMNAVAAGAAACALNIEERHIKNGLQRVAVAPSRLQTSVGPHGCRIIDDSYNANPGSLSAGLQTVAALSGEHWLVLGDMLELGEESAALHARAGREAAAKGFARLYALGEMSAHAARAFGVNGASFDSVPELCEALNSHLPESAGGVSVLVKGSRGMRMERIVGTLLGHGGQR